MVTLQQRQRPDMRSAGIEGMREQGNQKHECRSLPEKPISQENPGLSPSFSHEPWVVAECILQQDHYYATVSHAFLRVCYRCLCTVKTTSTAQ